MKRELDRMTSDSYDLLIIGGGISGACIAWDAALRGLKVALVDKADFGGATTAATSKLIHGGLRYLKNFEFGLVRESLRERRRLEIIAPHQVYPIPFLIPTYKWSSSNRPMIWAAMIFYDILSFDKNRLDDPEKHLPIHRRLSRDEVIAREPGVIREGLTGGAIYYDCQNVNPERLCLAFILSAAAKGADVANHAEVVELTRQGNRITGAAVQDRITGDKATITANVIINASGPWADMVAGLLGKGAERKIRRSKGIHIITRPISRGHAVVLRTPTGRHFFTVPWRGHSLIGTTDTEYFGDPDEVSVTEADIDAFIDETNASYAGANLKHDDVLFSYAGLRPIVDDQTEGVYDASRRYELCDHAKEDGVEGMITVIGGKYTTSRCLAEKVVDRIFQKLGRSAPACATNHTAVVGGETGKVSAFLEERRQSNRHGLGDDTLKSLVQNYGSEFDRVVGLLDQDSSLVEPIGPGRSEILAQVAWAAREEMAVTLSDLMLRRTGIATLGDPGRECVERCASLLGRELGWDDERRTREVEAFYRAMPVRKGA